MALDPGHDSDDGPPDSDSDSDSGSDRPLVSRASGATFGAAAPPRTPGLRSLLAAGTFIGLCLFLLVMLPGLLSSSVSTVDAPSAPGPPLPRAAHPPPTTTPTPHRHTTPPANTAGRHAAPPANTTAGRPAATSCLAPAEAALYRCPNVGAPAGASARLQAWVCAQRARAGYVTLPRATLPVGGVATYASRAYPKPARCLLAPDEVFAASETFGRGTPWSTHNPSGQAVYMSAGAPYYDKKLVSAGIEVRRNWKAASTTMPSLVKCVVSSSAKWREVPANAPTTDLGTRVVSTSRDPIARFASGVQEMMQRAVNGWCPPGPDTAAAYTRCSPTWLPYARTTWTRGSTWFAPLMRGDYDAAVQAFVNDTECTRMYQAAEHFNSQSDFLLGGDTRTDLVVRADDDDKAGTLRAGLGEAGGAASCAVASKNAAAAKPPGQLPDDVAHRIYGALQDGAGLVARLCAVYVQDFVCLGYEVPGACRGMF